MKKHKQRSPVTRRIKTPLVGKGEKGRHVMLCPFCNPTHPLELGKKYSCGTSIEVNAVQVVYRTKYDHNIRCIKCGKGGGKMVVENGAYVHINDCSPGTVVLKEPPRNSFFAKLVYTSPRWVGTILRPFLGNAQPIQEIRPDGVRTGNVIGYTFWKEK